MAEIKLVDMDLREDLCTEQGTVKLAMMTSALTMPALHTLLSVGQTTEELPDVPKRANLTATDLVTAKLDWFDEYETTHDEFRKSAKLTLSEVKQLCTAIEFEYGKYKFESRWKYSNAVRLSCSYVADVCLCML